MIPLSRENYTFWLDVEGSSFFAGQLRLLLYDFLKFRLLQKGLDTWFVLLFRGFSFL